MAREKRFIIKHPNGTYHAGHEIASTFDSIEVDGTGTKSVHTRQKLEPTFKDRANALRYATEQDAKDHLTHPGLEDPAAFAGCTLEPEDE